MWPVLQRAIDSGAVRAYGGTPGWAAWVAAQRASKELVILVAKDDATARGLEGDAAYFLGATQSEAIAYLPSVDVSPYGDLAPDRGAIVERLATLYRLTQPTLRPQIVVTSAEALVRKTMPPQELASRGSIVGVGDIVDRDAIGAMLIAAGWTRTPVVDEPGTFALRGGVMDVFAPLFPHPVRIELFGDSVESLRTFDAESQRTLRTIDRSPHSLLGSAAHPGKAGVIDRVILHPVRETIATGQRDVRTRLRAYAEEVAYPSKATRRLIEQLEAGGVFVGIEGLLPAFHDGLVAASSYVPAEARWIIVDPDGCKRAVAEILRDAEAQFGERTVRSQLAFPPQAHFSTQLDALSSPRRIELSSLEMSELHPPTDAGSETAVPLRVDVDNLHLLGQQLEHARTFGDTEHVEPLIAKIRAWRSDGIAVTIALDSHSRVERLTGVLAARGIIDIAITSAAPMHAFASPRDGIAFVTGDLIFGHRTHRAGAHKQRARDALLGSVSDWSQLAAGDFLVHQRHGVGRYLGLKRIAVSAPMPSSRMVEIDDPRSPSPYPASASAAASPPTSPPSSASPSPHPTSPSPPTTAGTPLPRDATRGGVNGPASPVQRGRESPLWIDTLQLEYDGGTLYLPVYRLGEVQRYVGAEGHPPRLDKLGGATWEATQSKVSRSVRALAEELLQLYAQRASLPGHRFPPADEQFHELEATFPFDETPDQEDAIAAVLADMEADRAMDRLICGDVGYGKTEVAVRAVFRCIQGGKQACVLAPTTILVEQHFRTLSERFTGFALNVARLSRFQSKAEQIDTVRKLAAGSVDVVVGTHRLLSPDVRFKNLGLLVIDEEQRFGVAHKERIKKAKTQVDVLTLTATPIPRTLHLAMAGVRDLSIIATPPADRRAVRTFVSRVDDTTIREALERELARGGQAFFISPTIDQAAQNRSRGSDDDASLPSRAGRNRLARTDDRSLQQWAEYLQGLVPTARIGIGHGAMSADALETVMMKFVRGDLDVLVATTIVESGLDIPRANTMFVARSDAFGLAQLYQLRGRIGRSKDRAYCYLLVPEPEDLTDSARRRLETLQRFTELGAGFQIASQDLEIRGGGELLGAKQSGSIAAVGFDRYIKMLEGSVAELRGQPIHSEIDPELTVDVPGFIPDDYIPDPGQRLELYKRLSAIVDDDDLARVMAEIADRYGPVPGDAIVLGELMAQKALARRLGALTLEVSISRVAIALGDGSPVGQAALQAGWRKLADGRYATAPPARQALQAVLAVRTCR